MDYLTLPASSTLSPIAVPYLPGFQLDNGDFAEFPARVGFATGAGVDISRPARETASLTQEWLFFGMIDIVAGAPVERASFVSRDGRHIEAKPLAGIIAETTRALRAHRDENHIESILGRLRVAIRASRRLDQVDTDDEDVVGVFLSIKVLIDFLRSFMDIGRMSGDQYSQHSSTRFSARALRLMVLNDSVSDMRELTPVQQALAERMVAQRWCPSQVVTVFCRTEYMMAYYLSFLARDNDIAEDHELCSTSTCTAFNTNLALPTTTSTARHVLEGCECPMVGVADEDVVRIVRNNDIPLVRITTEPDGEVSLQLEACSTFSDLGYTAISHVWADGMGNAEGNALPTCQLRKLAGYLHKQAGPGSCLSTSPPFWMDALCIPVHKYHKKANETAINKMALIYTAAAQVLVLDRDLENLSLEQTSTDFLVASTVPSKWNTRCWTLQEGVLARKCLFQFKDTTITISLEDQAAKERRQMFESNFPAWEFIKSFYEIDISWLSRESKKHSSSGVEGPFFGTEPAENIAGSLLSRALNEAARFVSGQRLPLVKFYFDSVQPEEREFLDRFVDTWNLLGRRQTTLPQDLHAIFANLTNVSFAQLQSVERPEARTQVILNSLGCFPTEILYNDYVRPLAAKDCANRWVPSHPGPEQIIGMTTLVPTRDGLFLKATPGFQSGFMHTGVILVKPGTMLLSEFQVLLNWEDKRISLELDLNCMLPEIDEFPRDEDQQACLTLDIHFSDIAQLGTGAARVCGARFLVLSQGNKHPDGHMSVRTRFDCPVRGTIHVLRKSTEASSNGPDEQELPLVAIHYMQSPFHEMIIEQSIDESVQQKYLRRDRDFYANKDLISLPMTVFDGNLLMALQLPMLPHVVLQRCVGFDVVPLWVHLFAFLFTFTTGIFSGRLCRWKVDCEERAVLDIYKATFEDDWVPGEPVWLSPLKQVLTRAFMLVLTSAVHWAPVVSLLSLSSFVASMGHFVSRMS